MKEQATCFSVGQIKHCVFTFRNVITQYIQEVEGWVQFTHLQDAFLLQILWFAEVKETVKLRYFRVRQT